MKPLKKNAIDMLENYDFEQIGDIVNALEFLRNQSIKIGDDDIKMIINSAFNLCFAAYYLALRSNALAGIEQNVPVMIKNTQLS